MFKTTPTGYVMGFANGYELSVHFGPGNYCSNRMEKTLRACKRTGEHVECINAEAMVFLTGTNDAIDIRKSVKHGVEQWALMGDGKGLSWATAEHVAALARWVSKLPMRADWSK